MQRRAIIGPSFSSQIPIQNKILAADGLSGVVLLLAYYAGGTNLFPPGITPSIYVEEGEEKSLKIDTESLTSLMSEISLQIGREFAQLQIGSLPVYLSALRNGFRANRNGQFPPVKNTFKRAEGEITIYPRSYQKDKEAGLEKLIPNWIPLKEEVR